MRAVSALVEAETCSGLPSRTSAAIAPDHDDGPRCRIVGDPGDEFAGLAPPGLDGRPLAGPSLPAEYSMALDCAPIGPCAGSCGTAAFLGQPVTVLDIETDPLWADYKALALPIGLRACWSSPIKARDDRVVGTFAFYY